MNLKNLNDISLDDIYSFLEHGTDVMDEELAHYINLLDKVRSMSNKIGEFGTRELIIKHLMKIEGLSRFLANRIYNDAIEYFFADVGITKQAYRNKIADMQESLIAMAIEMAKDVNDLSKISKMQKELFEMRQLDIEDPPIIPDELLGKPFKVYTFNPKDLGLDTTADREKLREFIDNLPDMTEKERKLIRQEALLEPLKLFPEDYEDARKSE